MAEVDSAAALAQLVALWTQAAPLPWSAERPSPHGSWRIMSAPYEDSGKPAMLAGIVAASQVEFILAAVNAVPVVMELLAELPRLVKHPEYLNQEEYPTLAAALRNTPVDLPSLGVRVYVTAIAPEQRDTLDEAIALWKELRAQQRAGGVADPEDEDSAVYRFAYWLIRYSGLVEPRVAAARRRTVAVRVRKTLADTARQEPPE